MAKFPNPALLQGNRPHDVSPVKYDQPMPAARRSTGPNTLCRSALSKGSKEKVTKRGRFSKAKVRRSPQHMRREKRDAPCRHRRRIDRQRTFPIVSPRASRLPPWEDFQRGPTEHQAVLSRHGPHRKSFTIPDFRKLVLRRSTASPNQPFANRVAFTLEERPGCRDSIEKALEFSVLVRDRLRQLRRIEQNPGETL